MAKNPDFTFEVSQYCSGYARLLIPTKTAREIVCVFTGFYRIKCSVLTGYSPGFEVSGDARFQYGGKTTNHKKVEKVFYSGCLRDLIINFY